MHHHGVDFTIYKPSLIKEVKKINVKFNRILSVLMILLDTLYLYKTTIIFICPKCFWIDNRNNMLLNVFNSIKDNVCFGFSR